MYEQIVEPFRDADGNIYMHLNRDNAESKPHPIRKRHALVFYGDTRTNRRMDDPPYKDGDPHLHVEYEDYQAIWSLPGVCHQIREEFAPIFWTHVTLNYPVIISIPNGGYFGHILEFLEHRQQAVESLKSFTLGLLFKSNSEKAQRDLQNLFSVLEEGVAIDSMKLSISIDEFVAQELLSNPDMPWIQILRRIKKELWLDEALLPATREQLYALLNPKLLPGKDLTVQEEYLLVREV